MTKTAANYRRLLSQNTVVKYSDLFSSVVLWGHKYNIYATRRDKQAMLWGKVNVKKMKGLNIVFETDEEVGKHVITLPSYYLTLKECDDLTGMENDKIMEFLVSGKREDVKRAWSMAKERIAKLRMNDTVGVEIIGILSKFGYPRMTTFDDTLEFMLGQKAKYSLGIPGNMVYHAISISFEEVAAANE